MIENADSQPEPRTSDHSRPGDHRAHRRSARAGERLCAIGDVNGLWPLTHVGKYQGDIASD